ncbi:hypothetical protein GGX14DRAFT_418425 [Mycena pura]|uniref:Phospholipid/glycerol acyltransferase domain-containing protein n=1 Tax=Mycena pura TaxID=153505 RepID=A0AAD6YS65_9AGAR|nr:hypothetical protein GGX14DRAFT_418425 [Mycena pura]
MEVRIAYRILRKISAWALVGFYSDVYVDLCKHSVPEDAPLILTPCHHNEMIDAGALAATLPHRRMVSFWVKSSAFSHPVLGPILSSCGAIPVCRNPNKADSSVSKSDLFDATSVELARNQVVGIFPEGTSYTEPAIAQVLSGAAWAALEFMRSQRDNSRSVIIIPVGIVYSDKSKFRSRVHIEYGAPMDMASYIPSSLFETEDADAETAMVKAVMKDVEAQLFNMTINAPDWETMYAAQMTRDILWTDERNVKLKDWVVVGQTLVKLFSPSASSPDAELVSVKRALTRYFSLLHHTNVSNAQLAFIIPDPSALPNRLFVLRFMLTALRTVLNPLFLLFIPLFLAHFPAYLFASLGSRLAPAGEEESQAQFKIWLGGLGAGLGVATSSYWITRLSNSFAPQLSGMQSNLFLFSFTAWLLLKCHFALVDSNYRRLQRLYTAYKVLWGVLQPRSWDLPSGKLALYEKPPAPAANPYIRKRDESTALGGKEWLKAQPPVIPSRKVIYHLLLARQAAISALARYLQGGRPEEQMLRSLGGVLPV